MVIIQKEELLWSVIKESPFWRRNKLSKYSIKIIYKKLEVILVFKIILKSKKKMNKK